MAMSCSLHAAELESLKQFINRKPLFLSDKNDTELVASRCSALYLVLSSRTEKVSNSKEVQSIAKEFGEQAFVFDQVREVISKVTDHKIQSSVSQQKQFAINYADITLTSWKQYNDIFRGMVNDDLDVCRNNYPQFKKIANNLSKEFKK